MPTTGQKLDKAFAPSVRRCSDENLYRTIADLEQRLARVESALQTYGVKFDEGENDVS